MDVDDSCKLRPILVPRIKFHITHDYKITIYTYVVAKKLAIILKISVSLLVVSSNPGVSMSTTRLPSRSNSSAS